jgi:NitT/TauT family transport system ATP-binding protein
MAAKPAGDPMLPGGAEAVIRASGLSVTFEPARQVLRNVELSVTRGEFVALIGASGCGKTTLLNVIAGLVPFTANRVEISGAPPAAGRPDICYVLARDALLPWRTAIGNVEYGMELSGVDRDERRRRATQFIEKVGLSAARDLYPSRLSQGMRQRVSLARAFAVGRDFYLMDEPFSALDTQTKFTLHDHLLALWERSGATVVFVTHDIGEAITLADRVLVMSTRGTGIVDEIKVDIARPRSAEALQGDTHYHDLYRKAWLSLKAHSQ